MSDIEEARRRIAEYARRLMETGQGESSGPSFSSLDIEQRPIDYNPFEDVMRGPRVDEQGRPLDLAGWQVAYSNWREANGRPVHTGEMTFRLGGGADYSRPASPTFSERLGVGRQQTGGIMKVSTRGPELTVGEKRALKEGYKSILRQGFGRLGVPDKKLVLWIDDRAYEVRTEVEYWEMSGNSLYIGNGTARPGDKLRSVSERLAVTAGLMGLTGHASDPELLVEFEKALARMLAGQFEEAVKPLGVSGDDRPVGKMAWSASGVAAFVDGQWCSPVTGEPVEVGSGWTVIETGEGPREAASVSANPLSEARIRWDSWVVAFNWSLTPTNDGRQAVCYGDRDVMVADLVTYNLSGCEVVETRNGWGITYPLEALGEPVVQAVGEPARSRSQEDWEEMLGGTVYGVTRGIDGRLGVNTANLNSFEALRGTFGEFDLEYVTPHPMSTQWEGLTVVKLVNNPAISF